MKWRYFAEPTKEMVSNAKKSEAEIMVSRLIFILFKYTKKGPKEYPPTLLSTIYLYAMTAARFPPWLA